jgi:RimJ/RimL family protein N-acetyltransferase
VTDSTIDSGPWVQPVVLEGAVVRLEPLSLDHLDGLVDAGSDPGVWRWLPVGRPDRDAMARLIESALADRERGSTLPFATIERSTGRPIGSSRYLAIEPAHRRIEIGWTWLGTAWQRTGANREAKLLMLEHAFEALGCIRVEFKTDQLNLRSQEALRAIGAVEEGTFRNHMIVQEGRIRHSVYFSITDTEWPAVRERLVAGLGRPGADGSFRTGGRSRR